VAHTSGSAAPPEEHKANAPNLTCINPWDEFDARTHSHPLSYIQFNGVCLVILVESDDFPFSLIPVTGFTYVGAAFVATPHD